MNCKQGDLAVVVKASGWGFAGEVSKLLVGRIVRVIKLAAPSNGSQCLSDLVWKFEQPIKLVVEGRTATVDGIADHCLRPIRDPGDDAQDESKSWLPPVPTKEHA